MAADFSVVAIIAAYNEADIIEHVVSDLVNQGIHVYFLDDGSTDGTVAAVEQYLGRGVLGIEPRPDAGEGAEPPLAFEWERILLRKTQLATELDATWFIHHDADEFRESPWSHLSLKDAIRQVDALGFNAIDFTSLDFWPVHDRFRAGDDVREAFTRYAEQAPYDRLQIRCWKKSCDLELASSGGHDARFPDRKIFPLRFILRHYPIRGQAHGERKVFHERQNRFLEKERAMGWHVQYDELREGASFIRDAAALTAYDPDALRVALTLRHRGVEALEASLGESRSVAETLRLEAERLRDDLSRACAEAAALRDELDKRWDEIAAMNAEFIARSAEAEALHNDVGRHRKALGETRAELVARRDETTGLSAELSARRAELEKIHRSFSWRLTLPLRAMVRAFRGR